MKLVIYRKCKEDKENRILINEEIRKLNEVEFITMIKYSKWLEKMKLVRKASGKWKICIDFTGINLTCPMDFFLLLNIDKFIDHPSRYKTLSFIDTYLRYK